MIKITNVVEEILYSSEVVLSAFNEGLLNYSAYAKSIKKSVQQKTHKIVSTGSIVVALSRLAKKKKTKSHQLNPAVKINDLTVKSPIIGITYDKTQSNFNYIRELYTKVDINTSDFLEITHGISEITIIASQHLKKDILQNFKSQKPKSIIENLVALTVKFDEKYINEPNVIFSLIRNLSIKRINIIELVSTYTELTFILKKEDLQSAFLTLNGVFQQV